MEEADDANSNPDFSLCHHVVLGHGSVAGRMVVDAESIAGNRN
jgi:hypothetical protein